MVIKFFASFKEHLNCDEERWEYFDSDLLVDDVITSLVERGDPWDRVLSSTKPLVAINQEMASYKDRVSFGDELAIFPPVTGG